MERAGRRNRWEQEQEREPDRQRDTQREAQRKFTRETETERERGQAAERQRGYLEGNYAYRGLQSPAIKHIRQRHNVQNNVHIGQRCVANVGQGGQAHCTRIPELKLGHKPSLCQRLCTQAKRVTDLNFGAGTPALCHTHTHLDRPQAGSNLQSNRACVSAWYVCIATTQVSCQETRYMGGCCLSHLPLAKLQQWMSSHTCQYPSKPP